MSPEQPGLRGAPKNGQKHLANPYFSRPSKRKRLCSTEQSSRAFAYSTLHQRRGEPCTMLKAPNHLRSFGGEECDAKRGQFCKTASFVLRWELRQSRLTLVTRASSFWVDIRRLRQTLGLVPLKAELPTELDSQQACGLPAGHQSCTLPSMPPPTWTLPRSSSAHPLTSGQFCPAAPSPEVGIYPQPSNCQHCRCPTHIDINPYNPPSNDRSPKIPKFRPRRPAGEQWARLHQRPVPCSCRQHVPPRM